MAVASARAGNVIGGGDWSDDRLLPDAVRAWTTKQPLVVRRPLAVRPWQHVLEPLAGYMVLAQKLWDQPELAGSYNFGPLASGAVTVGEVVELARRAFGTGEVRYSAELKGPVESEWLALDAEKARTVLGVAPVLTLAASYRAHHGMVSRSNRRCRRLRTLRGGYCRLRNAFSGSVRENASLTTLVCAALLLPLRLPRNSCGPLSWLKQSRRPESCAQPGGASRTRQWPRIS